MNSKSVAFSTLLTSFLLEIAPTSLRLLLNVRSIGVSTRMTMVVTSCTLSSLASGRVPLHFLTAAAGSKVGLETQCSRGLVAVVVLCYQGARLPEEQAQICRMEDFMFEPLQQACACIVILLFNTQRLDMVG